ncbi:nucleolar protein 58-like protein [Tanacetum coccineum]
MRNPGVQEKRTKRCKMLDIKKEFKNGEEVLVFNSRLKLFLGKLNQDGMGPTRMSRVVSNREYKGSIEVKTGFFLRSIGIGYYIKGKENDTPLAHGYVKSLIARIRYDLISEDKISRNVITIGSTTRILLLYQSEYSEWRGRFMNYLKEQTYGEVMIHSVTHGEQPLPVVTQVSLTGTTLNALLVHKDHHIFTSEEKPKFVVLSIVLEQSATRMETVWYIDEANKNLMDINIEALYNIPKQNQGDVNDALGIKKKAVVSEESDDEDISGLKKITALLEKAINQKKYYVKPTNNNMRTSSASTSANKKPKYVKQEENKEDKKEDGKKRDISKVKCYICKKEGHFAKDCKKAKAKDYVRKIL